MEIIRAKLDDTDIFCEEKLSRGGCCFYTKDRTNRFSFDISGQNAIIYADSDKFIEEAIDEFLFYSNFITCISSPEGDVIRENDCSLIQMKVKSISPSQFYINERKLTHCKRWIKSERDIMIPIGIIGGKAVSLDGHTRLRAAYDMGYEYVNVYEDNWDEYIVYFVNEAAKRGLSDISQVEVVGDLEYNIKWHKFCDDYFRSMS